MIFQVNRNRPVMWQVGGSIARDAEKLAKPFALWTGNLCVLCARLYMCVCVCVRAYVRACVHACVRACVFVCLSDYVQGAWAGLSAGQLPPATKHWVGSFHSTSHCTPGHQNWYAPTKILLGLPAKFQTWTLAAWLWPGPESHLLQNSFRGTPSSTTPCPSPPPDTAGLPDL